MTQPTELAVLIDGEHAGLLCRNRSGRLRLEYDADYEARASSPPLSLSMPLRGGPYGNATASRWISSLLPDHPRALERWYRREGVSTPFGLLASRIGYDCAGAVQFCRPDRLSELLDRSSGLTPLTPEDMAERVDAMAEDPAQWDRDDLESCYSLAGFQNKMALHRAPTGWARPHGSVPTTHILKPRHRDGGQGAVVEHLCAATARRVGLDAVVTDVEFHGGHPVTVVQRYDRHRPSGRWRRRHQEDMCQALGLDGKRRHEWDGGPGMAAIGDFMHHHCLDSDTDVRKFADGLLWALITVNRDAHARNYSLRLSGREVHLAPLYDLQSSLPYGVKKLGEREMAMRYGSTYSIYSASSNHSLADVAARLSLPNIWLIDRAEQLAASTNEAMVAEIEELSPEARRLLDVDDLLERLNIRTNAIASTAEANRGRIQRAGKPPSDDETAPDHGFHAESLAAAHSEPSNRAASTSSQECDAPTNEGGSCTHPRPAPGGYCSAGHKRPSA